VFSAKDKIDDWLEMYTRVMELNYWGSTEVKSATFDEDAGEWIVQVERNGQAITLRPKQLVLATGMSSKPNLPSIKGSEVFKGEQHHSSKHPGPDGYVGKKTVETGEHVAPGQALLTLVEPHPWVVANFRETQLRHVRAGDAVQLRFDALPQRTFSGRIDSLSPATGGQFALLPPDNATGNFTKVTQRVPVKILLDGPAATEPRIRPGLSVVVTLQPGSESR